MISWYRCLNRLPQNHHQVDHRGDKGSSLLGSEKLMCKYICIRLVSNQSFTFSLCSISFYLLQSKCLEHEINYYIWSPQKCLFALVLFISNVDRQSNFLTNDSCFVLFSFQWIWRVGKTHQRCWQKVTGKGNTLQYFRLFVIY